MSNPDVVEGVSDLCLRLKRSGNSFSVYTSSNGVDWVRFFQTDLSLGGEGDLPPSMLVGVAGVSLDSKSGTPVGFRNLQFFGPDVQRNPAVAFNGTHYLTVWESPDQGDVHAAISCNVFFAMLADANGVPLLAEPMMIAHVPGGGSLTPVVAAKGDRFLVTWVDRRNAANNGADIYGLILFLHDNKLQIDSAPIPISTAGGDQLSPAITDVVGQDYWLVAWQDGRNKQTTGDDIFAARVNTTGQVLEPLGTAICVHPGDQLTPKVAAQATIELSNVASSVVSRK